MSARTPFVPMNSRPASRANMKEPAQFIPDPNNPLNHENAAVKTKQPAGESETQTANPVPKTPFRPLNTSNLQKKNPTTAVNRSSRNSMPRRSTSVIENTVTHASESRTDAQTVNNRHNIVSPTPISASHPASPLFSNNAATGMFTNPAAFKLPMNPALQTSPDMKTADTSGLESMTLNPVPKVYKLNTSHSKQNGPQRVLADANGPQPRLKRGLADADTDEQSFEREQQKRFKVGAEDTKMAHSMGYRAYSPQTILSSPADSRRSNSEYSPENNQQPPEYQTPPMGSSRGEFFFNPNAFSRMLGRDADVYIEEQAERYDQLAAKWRDCTMEEWLAGANEITVKYTKILDLVKSHINSKLTLFASLHTHLDDHNNTLVERQKTLGGAKQKLLSEAGNLLGKDD